ncbi:hypothetical protein SCLCIDRAFT_17566 [Scleroderma citrinum Foug A]|uniref:SH3 domain-containing protein n=1 Tax=Scleroderma citrinum Foug A TaxID=1036808 RepID=A0A0C3DEN0_9AGAM|nr:hypothetical protein SCLCIDRAFT_17566 [Scleroderma citrinum Foug A]
MSVRPFSPSETFSFPKPPIPILGTILAMAIPEDPVPAVNPFEDSVDPPVLSHIETICRPFVPTLEDELLVSPGDRVRVLQVFDDGWSMVEKVGLGPSTKGNQQRRGLIPVDCFREAGQALPTFLAQKGLSDYVLRNGVLLAEPHWG